MPLSKDRSLHNTRDCDIFQTSQKSALHNATKLNSYSKVALLLEHGANVGLRWRGMTVLETAIAYTAGARILTVLSEQVAWNDVIMALEKYSFNDETPYECSVRLGVQA